MAIAWFTAVGEQGHVHGVLSSNAGKNAFDWSASARHNAFVTLGRVARRFVTGVAALGVLSLALLPPEHLHVTQTHDGHYSDVVHRHYTPHTPHQLANGTASIGDHSIGDHDDQAVWLDAPFTTSTKVVAPAPSVDAVLNQGQLAAPLPLKRLDAVAFAALLVHDPPLTTPPGLRAPPPSI